MEISLGSDEPNQKPCTNIPIMNYARGEVTPQTALSHFDVAWRCTKEVVVRWCLCKAALNVLMVDMAVMVLLMMVRDIAIRTSSVSLQSVVRSPCFSRSICMVRMKCSRLV
jgi:hypothetical protein